MLNKDDRQKIKRYWTNELKKESLNNIETYIHLSEEFEKDVVEITFFEDYKIVSIAKGIETVPTILWEIVGYDFQEKVLDDKLRNVIEKNYITYLSPEEYEPISIKDAEIRLLSERDKEAFERLKKQTTPEDNENSFVEMDHPVVFGCLIGDRLVSVSSNLYWGDHIADIGILTDSSFRKRGFARATVGALCEYNIKNGKINQYRCVAENTGSYHTAKSVGFETIALVYRFRL